MSLASSCVDFFFDIRDPVGGFKVMFFVVCGIPLKDDFGFWIGCDDLTVCEFKGAGALLPPVDSDTLRRFLGMF